MICTYQETTKARFYSSCTIEKLGAKGFKVYSMAKILSLSEFVKKWAVQG
jgi:hypothetical protein